MLAVYYMKIIQNGHIYN